MNWEKWQAKDWGLMQPDCTLHALTMILCCEHIDLDRKYVFWEAECAGDKTHYTWMQKAIWKTSGTQMKSAKPHILWDQVSLQCSSSFVL